MEFIASCFAILFKCMDRQTDSKSRNAIASIKDLLLDYVTLSWCAQNKDPFYNFGVEQGDLFVTLIDKET